MIKIKELYKLLLSFRGLGNTTTLIKGLEAMGGGYLLMPNLATKTQEGLNVERLSLTSLASLVGRKLDKPVVIDLSAVVEVLREEINKQEDLENQIRLLLIYVKENSISLKVALDLLPEVIEGRKVMALLTAGRDPKTNSLQEN